MADGRKAGSSGHHRYFTRRSRKPKEPEIVVLSDSSSSESNDEEVVHACSQVDRPSLKSEASAKVSVDNVELNPECPVCLQPSIHPARLPCGHIFCFLCLKGIAQQSRRCAMCRQEISPDYLDRPDLLHVPESLMAKEAESEDGYQWFYEGRNGWWQFEERISKDLEEVHQLGLSTFETLICGALYTIDFKAMVQYNKSNPGRKRRIKRDLSNNVVLKGVAGWWQYDERTSKELEASYKSGIRTCELLIAGFLYTADFDSMVQIRRNEPHRRRRIKRDLATIPSKGIAGIRSTVNVDTVSEQLSSLTLSDSANEQDEQN